MLLKAIFEKKNTYIVYRFSNRSYFMELGSIGFASQRYDMKNVQNSMQYNQQNVSLESRDSLELSSKKEVAPKNLKQKLAELWDNATAVRPSALTYKKYGLQTIETHGDNHHMNKSVSRYVELPVGIKVKTPYGIKVIKENQVALLDMNGNFNVIDIKAFLDGEKIIRDTGSIEAFARKDALDKEDEMKQKQAQIDSALDAAGIKYIGRPNKDNDELPDKVVIEINGDRKEFDTVLYTKDDYKYKGEILNLLKAGKLEETETLFY